MSATNQTPPTTGVVGPFWRPGCPYYTVTAGGQGSQNAAWAYLHPSPPARRVKGRAGFWGDVRVHIERPRDRS